jgi:uncharacterized protein (DUF433 family)
MTDELRQRIVSTPGVMGGKPCVRGTRLTVRYIVGLLAHGATIGEILVDHPSLTEDDISACLLYAADMLERTPSTTLATSR